MEKEMVMGRELVITTKLDNFVNTPSIGDYGKRAYTTKLFDAKIPRNITLGTTYYAFNDGNLIAFKIRAYSFSQSTAYCTTWYMIETPLETTWSASFLNKPIFETIKPL